MAKGLPLELDKVPSLEEDCVAVVNQHRGRLGGVGDAPDPVLQGLLELLGAGIGKNVMPYDALAGVVLLDRNSREGILDPLLGLSLTF